MNDDPWPGGHPIGDPKARGKALLADIRECAESIREQMFSANLCGGRWTRDMHRMKIPAGDTLYREGQSGEHAFLILSGEAAMERNGVTLSAGKGAVIGFSALVSRLYGATATAITGSDLLVFTRRELRGIIRSDPDWAMLIIEGIIDLVGKMNAAAEPKPASITEPRS